MTYSIGIIVTLFLSFILLTKKKKTIADKILFVWLCVTSLHLALFAIISSQKYLQFSYLLGLEIPIPLLHGPFLFLYTTSLTTQRLITNKVIFHFIPFSVAVLSIIPFLFKSQEEKIFVYRNEGEGYSTLTGIIFSGIIISGIVYILLSLRSLSRYKNAIKQTYSYTEKINLQWLFYLIIGLSGIWIFVLFAEDEYIFTTVVLYVFFVGYFGIKQVGIFTNQPPLENLFLLEPKEPPAETTVNSENIKYEKSLLSDLQLKNIHSALMKLMLNDKMYLTPELTLPMVAERLNVHPNTLSEVINRAEQKNFFDFINTMRVEEFKARIVKPENHKYTLLSIAYDCGFNSKTSFNRNFRNITGISPSDYLKTIRIRLDS